MMRFDKYIMVFLTLLIMLMNPCDSISLFHKPCETIHKDV
jgi:hypothetical protein